MVRVLLADVFEVVLFFRLRLKVIIVRNIATRRKNCKVIVGITATGDQCADNTTTKHKALRVSV